MLNSTAETTELAKLPTELSEPEKPESFASLVKRLGNAESTIMLYSDRHLFQIPEVDGAIAYHKIGNCAVVVGDPICLPRDIPELVSAFHRYCDEHHLKTTYLLTHHEFAHWGVENGCRTLIQVGVELSINPMTFKAAHNVRRKVNCATTNGVKVSEYTHSDAAAELGIKSAIKTWLDGRRGPQIHMGTLDFDHNSGNRIFYAHQNDRVIGILILTPTDRMQGWAVSYNIAIAGAPVGTTESLMCSTLACLARENCHFLCLGPIAGGELREFIGISPWGIAFVRMIFKAANWVFKLDAKATYLNKYKPISKPVFLLCKGRLTISQLLAIKQVLNIRL